ncbi:MAG TPA: protein kinase [Thermoanaerobaculia bacterium]|nr:protein kinase [Thermoanaerobaculia bacterium]
MPLSEGTRLGNCRLVRKLGEGGMAEVWEAVDVTLERRVAIKVVKETISSLPEFDARFRREAKTAAQLEHPNILQIYGFGVENGIAYIEMPCLSGGTLASRLESGPPPPPETVCEWVDDLASALDAAHARGIIHRDIKTVNVLFDQSGRIVLADFGLAKSMADSSGLTAAGTLMGTPMYLSPEQSRGESLTPASDQFSLGVLAYRMLTGQLPWGPNAAPALVMMRIVSQAPPAPSSLRPDLPPAVDAVFDQVLAKKPEGRYESCGAFALALRDVLLPRRHSAFVDSPTEIAAQPVFVSPAPVAALPSVPLPRARPVVASIPASAPRRTWLVVLLLLFLGVNSVVLALVVWDKVGAKLPWARESEPVSPVARPVPVLSPTPSPTHEPASAPMVVVEQTPAAAPVEAETPAPAVPTEIPTPEPIPTVVPSPTVLPALPQGAIPPVRTTDVRPTFSDDLIRRHAGLDGRVELEVLVLADGSIGSIHVVRGIDPEIDAVVVQAAKSQLGYTPASLKGRPIPARSTVIVGVRFRLATPPG